MTSDNELRDRVAAVMYCHKHPLARMEDALRMARGEGMDSKRGQTNVVQRQYLPWAQAIIDDLHLEAYDFTRHDGHTTTHVHGWVETQ